jgi:hypothetical protein
MDLLLFLSLVACSLDALVGFISSKISNNPVNKVFFWGGCFFQFCEGAKFGTFIIKSMVIWNFFPQNLANPGLLNRSKSGFSIRQNFGQK